MNLTNEIRVELGKAVRDRILAAWGPAGVVVEGKLRACKYGPWQPGQQTAPACTVVDAGQRQTDFFPGDGVTVTPTGHQLLSLQLVLDLEEQWDRDEGAAGWIDFIERLRGDLVAWRPEEGLGIIEVRYVADDPWEAVLASGQSFRVWIVEIEIEYALAYVTAQAGQ